MSLISERKQAHLDICLTETVEYGSAGFERIHLVHHALPELSLDEIDTSLYFLGSRIAAPIFISCMTGGTKDNDAYDYNMRFAEAAERVGIPVGLGSMRVLLENEALLPQFSLKRAAPSVPLIANIGAAQLRGISFGALDDALKAVQADALAVHLNPAQELCQEHGERTFRGVHEALREYIAHANGRIKIIVKETGCGMSPAEVREFLGMGAAYVDIAGRGGTSWPAVELLRDARTLPHADASLAAFSQWGNPTALLLLALHGAQNIIASGGVRSALDVVKSLALGAVAAGLALPVLRHAEDAKTLSAYLQRMIEDIKKLLLLCRAQSPADMQRAAWYADADMLQALRAFCGACGTPVPAQFSGNF